MAANEVSGDGSKLQFDGEKYKYQMHMVILCGVFSVNVYACAHLQVYGTNGYFLIWY